MAPYFGHALTSRGSNAGSRRKCHQCADGHSARIAIEIAEAKATPRQDRPIRSTRENRERISRKIHLRMPWRQILADSQSTVTSSIRRWSRTRWPMKTRMPSPSCWVLTISSTQSPRKCRANSPILPTVSAMADRGVRGIGISRSSRTATNWRITHRRGKPFAGMLFPA